MTTLLWSSSSFRSKCALNVSITQSYEYKEPKERAWPSGYRLRYRLRMTELSVVLSRCYAQNRNQRNTTAKLEVSFCFFLLLLLSWLDCKLQPTNIDIITILRSPWLVYPHDPGCQIFMSQASFAPSLPRISTITAYQRLADILTTGQIAQLQILCSVPGIAVNIFDINTLRALKDLTPPRNRAWKEVEWERGKYILR